MSSTHDSSFPWMLICPVCKRSLQWEGESFRCIQCRTMYPRVQDVVCFNETRVYYGELPQNQMREFLALAERSGWEFAVATYLPDRNPQLIRTITDPNRIPWGSLIELNGGESVLDYGCGLGGVSVQLAKLVREVTAMDGCFDRIRFLQIRRDQEQLENISLVCNGNVGALPFASGCFDLVVLNMVFPYLSVSLTGEATKTAELRILGEIKRVIKPGGSLYISLRNKYGISRLRQLITSRRRQADDSTFVRRSLRYYERLFREADLGKTKGFWLVPDYKHPRYLINLNKPACEVAEQVEQIAEFSYLQKAAAKLAILLGRKRELPETMAFICEIPR